MKGKVTVPLQTRGWDPCVRIGTSIRWRCTLTPTVSSATETATGRSSALPVPY